MRNSFKEYKELFAEMMIFIKHRKSYWLAPLIFILLLLGLVFFVLEGSVIAPLIYALF